MTRPGWLQDMRTGLSQEGQPFTVPLLRLAQFLRQAGLLPKLISRLITQMHRVSGPTGRMRRRGWRFRKPPWSARCMKPCRQRVALYVGRQAPRALLAC